MKRLIILLSAAAFISGCSDKVPEAYWATPIPVLCGVTIHMPSSFVSGHSFVTFSSVGMEGGKHSVALRQIDQEWLELGVDSSPTVRIHPGANLYVQLDGSVLVLRDGAPPPRLR